MRQRLVPIILIVAFATVGCHPPITIVTPQGKVAYTANEVLKRVENLQNAAIMVGDIPNSGVPTTVIRILVTFTVEAAKVLQTTPNGWGQTVAVAWGNAKQQIPLRYLNDPNIQAAVLSVDMVLAIFLPPGGGA